MAIIKSIPSKRVINGLVIETSEVALVNENTYKTSGESCIIVRGVHNCTLTLDPNNTDHIVVKAMAPVVVNTTIGKIDEEYDELELDKYSCVEFRFVGGNWYILSSDGLKQS
jgi:hypothetical protein